MLSTRPWLFLLLMLLGRNGIAANSAGPSALDNVQMTRQQIEARVAIEALGIEYFYLLDHGQSDKLADLFTEDGVQDNGDGDAARKVGRQAIRDYYASRSKTIVSRHVSTNLRLVFVTPTRVTGTRTFTRYGADGPGIHPAVPSVAEYNEVYVRGADGRWRFESRKVTSLFSANGEARPQILAAPKAPAPNVPQP